MDEQKFINFIRNGKFYEAKKILELSNLEQLYTILMDLGFEKNTDFSPYFFVLELIFDNESDFLHSTAAALLGNPFCWMPGAYNIAKRHTQKAIELAPNNTLYKKRMLWFYEIPERLITLEEAVDYAKEVLEVFPKDSAALRIMKRLEKRKENNGE